MEDRHGCVVWLQPDGLHRTRQQTSTDNHVARFAPVLCIALRSDEWSPYFLEFMLDLYNGTSRGLPDLLDTQMGAHHQLDIWIDDVTIGTGNNDVLKNVVDKSFESDP